MNFKKMLKNQWSYVYAGALFGIAQIIYMIGLWINNVNHGKPAHLKPITVTTDLGKMFRGVEVFINHIFGFKSELYGTYGTALVNGVEKVVPSSAGAFVPGIGWPIVGMIIGGFLVAKMERESRSWAYYNKKMLLASFVGGILFSYGTRLAGGCTLNHLMGGVPMMNIHSLVTVVFMALGGILSFYIMGKFKLANYFKHQETLSYVKNADKGEQATYKPGYKPLKNPYYLVGLFFVLLLISVALYNGFFNAVSMQHLKGGNLHPFNKSVTHEGWFYVVMTLLAGIIGGIGLAKSGFGTECALVALETGGDMKRKDQKYAIMGVPKITRTLMRSYAPFIGLATHWIVMLGFIIIAWVFFGAEPAFAGKVKYSLTAGSLIGGLLLGMGAVLLIGCEIRSYMRLGMGYLNTMIGFLGFAVGYLPFTLFYKAHKHFLSSTVIAGKNGSLTDKYKVYELFTDKVSGQQVILFIWWVFILFLLIYFIKKGLQNTGLKKVYLIHRSTEEAQEYIDHQAAEHQGLVNDVPAPKPVPPEAYPEA